jgi:hypothetical protein
VLKFTLGHKCIKLNPATSHCEIGQTGEPNSLCSIPPLAPSMHVTLDKMLSFVPQLLMSEIEIRVFPWGGLGDRYTKWFSYKNEEQVPESEKIAQVLSYTWNLSILCLNGVKKCHRTK